MHNHNKKRPIMHHSAWHMCTILPALINAMNYTPAALNCQPAGAEILLSACLLLFGQKDQSVWIWENLNNTAFSMEINACKIARNILAKTQVI